MKKAFLSIAAVAVAAVAMVSCGNNTPKNTDQKDSVAAVDTAAAAAPAAAAAAEQTASLADIVAKAKAEGDKWSEDEWKEQFKQAMLAYKPFAVEVDKAGFSDLDKLKEIEQKYANYPDLINEMAEQAKKTKGGKVITDQWLADTMKELGIPKI
jgi:predicted small lipoprotein YifL